MIEIKRPDNLHGAMIPASALPQPETNFVPPKHEVAKTDAESRKFIANDAEYAAQWKDNLQTMFDEIPDTPKSDSYFDSPQIAKAHEHLTVYLAKSQRQVNKFGGRTKFWTMCVDRFGAMST